jgi:hypothetical protein
MRVRLLTLGILVVLFTACGSSEDGPEPDGPELPGIRAAVQTSGSERDPYVTVLVCVDTPDATCQSEVVSPNGEVTFSSLAPGNYYAFLRDLNENCSLLGDWLLRVPLRDSIVTVGFDIQCQGPGTVRVSAVTTGTNQPTGYRVFRQTTCDDYYVTCDRKSLASSGSVAFTAFPGSRTFLLEDVAANCAVVSPANPATVAVIEDGVVELRFEVACQ